MNDEEQSNDKKQNSSGIVAFWAELRRRHVVRVAITYAVVAWLIIQIASSTFGWFDIPVWAYRFVVFMVILGFPLAVIVAWAFELTPEGIKTTKTARVQHPEAHKDESHAKKRHWFSLGVAAAVPTVIFGVLALFFFIRSGSLESELASTEQVELENEKSIAVLPLENMSSDPENVYFADGIHEEILTNLAKINDLLVIGRTSMRQYRDTVKTLKQIGEELGVGYLLEGSVQREGNRVAITVQLIDAKTEGHIWAETYNRTIDDIFAIRAAIAKEVAGQLKAVLAPEDIAEIEYRPTENQEAYDSFMRARESPYSEEGIQHCERAVALDPEFAEAWSFLARFRIFVWRWDYNRNNPELLAEAHQALDEAERYGPELLDIFHARNMFAYNEHNDIEAAIEYLLEALSIDPNYGSAQKNVAWRYLLLGRLVEAQHYFETAMRAEPLDDNQGSRLVKFYELRGMWEKARHLIEENISRGDERGRWNGLLAAKDYMQSGDREAYIAAIDLIPDAIEDPRYEIQKALLSRDYRSALNHLEENGSIDSTRFGFSLNWSFGANQLSFKFRSSNLLAGLVEFYIGDQEKQLIEAEKARTYLESIVEIDPIADPDFRSNLAICYALEGKRNLMEAIIAKVREQASSANWKYRRAAISEVNIAIAYLVLGENDKAIETLEAASKMDSPIFLNRELDLWFIFDRLRGNPRFDALLK